MAYIVELLNVSYIAELLEVIQVQKAELLQSAAASNRWP